MGIGAADTCRLEQVGIADLEPDDARVRRCDVGSQSQSLGGFDVGEDSDRTFYARSRLEPRKRTGGLAHLVPALRHRQVQDVKARPDDHTEVILEQPARQTVRTDHNHLPVIGRALSKEGTDRSPCFGLPVGRDCILEIERECVGDGGRRLGEEFRT